MYPRSFNWLVYIGFIVARWSRRGRFVTLLKTPYETHYRYKDSRREYPKFPIKPPR
jgi:hypothetical protein